MGGPKGWWPISAELAPGIPSPPASVSKLAPSHCELLAGCAASSGLLYSQTQTDGSIRRNNEMRFGFCISTAEDPACRGASILGGQEATVTQQRLGAGVAPAEVAEDLLRRAPATEAEDGIPEAFPDLRHRRVVVQPDLLKGREGVGGENLSPFVAEVARGVPASEYVAEATQEAVEVQRRHHGRLLRDFLLAVPC